MSDVSTSSVPGATPLLNCPPYDAPVHLQNPSDSFCAGLIFAAPGPTAIRPSSPPAAVFPNCRRARRGTIMTPSRRTLSIRGGGYAVSCSVLILSFDLGAAPVRNQGLSSFEHKMGPAQLRVGKPRDIVELREAGSDLTWYPILSLLDVLPICFGGRPPAAGRG